MINSKTSMPHLISSTVPKSLRGFRLWSVRLSCGNVKISIVHSFTEHANVWSCPQISGQGPKWKKIILPFFPASLTVLGQTLSAMIIGVMSNKFGRRKTMLLMSLPALLSWLLIKKVNLGLFHLFPLYFISSSFDSPEPRLAPHSCHWWHSIDCGEFRKKTMMFSLAPSHHWHNAQMGDLKPNGNTRELVMLTFRIRL